MSGLAPSSSSKAPRPARWKRRKLHLLSLACLLALMGGLALYLQSDSFRETLRRKVITELEAITGGEVEVESLSWRLTRLEVDLRGLTIHGTEGKGPTPYLHASRFTVRMRVTS